MRSIKPKISTDVLSIQRQQKIELQGAITCGNTKKVRWIAENHNVDLSYENNYPIREACLKNHVKLVKFLLTRKEVEPSDYENGAIRNAALGGHLGIVKLLIKDKRVLQKGLYSTFKWIPNTGHVEILKIFLENENFNMSALEEAMNLSCICGELEIVKILRPMVPHLRKDPIVSVNNREIIKILLEYPEVDFHYASCFEEVSSHYLTIVKGEISNIYSVTRLIFFRFSSKRDLYKNSIPKDIVNKITLLAYFYELNDKTFFKGYLGKFSQLSRWIFSVRLFLLAYILDDTCSPRSDLKTINNCIKNKLLV